MLGGLLLQGTGGCAGNHSHFVGSEEAKIASPSSEANVDVVRTKRALNSLPGCEDGRKGLHVNDLRIGELTNIIGQASTSVGVTTVVGLATVYP